MISLNLNMKWFAKLFNELYNFWCREAGVVVKNLDTTCGEVRINLGEDLLLKEKDQSDTSPQPSAEVSPEKEESAHAKKPRGTNALSAVSKYNSIFPEKVE